jgi:hypothetical protein
MALMTQGEDVEIDFRGPKVIWSHKWPGAPKAEPPDNVSVVGLAEIPKTDVVVMQRPARRWWGDIAPVLQSHGIRVVVDIDDRYDAIHPRNANRFDPSKLHIGPQWVQRIVADADLVTVTTPALAEHYAPEKSVVLPNLIPAQWLALPTERHRIPQTVGWPGDVTQHPGDLAATKGGLAAAMKRTDWRFRVPVAQKVARRIPVGRTEIVHLTDNEVAKETGLPPAQIDDRGGSQFWDWPKLVAELEIGIVPLAASEFNFGGKSCLKAMEISALGIPVVMSPTPDNVRLHELGIGLLANTHEEWRDHLRALIDSEEYRTNLGSAGRAVMATMTYEAKAHLWHEAWCGK